MAFQMNKKIIDSSHLIIVPSYTFYLSFNYILKP